MTDKNYKQLVQMQEQLAPQGLEIFAFPCNQFAGQEKGSDEDIKEFVREKYGTNKFKLMQKCDVNGPDAHPVYRYLRSHSVLHDENSGKDGTILWNFQKFVVDAEGKVIEMHEPATAPDDFKDELKAKLV